jgi:hypothetical protein
MLQKYLSDSRCAAASSLSFTIITIMSDSTSPHNNFHSKSTPSLLITSPGHAIHSDPNISPGVEQLLSAQKSAIAVKNTGLTGTSGHTAVIQGANHGKSTTVQISNTDI